MPDKILKHSVVAPPERNNKIVPIIGRGRSVSPTIYARDKSCSSMAAAYIHIRYLFQIIQQADVLYLAACSQNGRTRRERTLNICCGMGQINPDSRVLLAG